MSIAVLQFLAALSALGIEAVVVRELALGNRPVAQVLGTALVLKAAATTAVMFLTLIAVLLAKSVGGESAVFVLISIVCIALPFQTADAIDYLFRSKSRLHNIVLWRLVAFAGSVAVRIAVLLSTADVIIYVWAVVAEFVFVAVASWVAYKRSYGNSIKPAWSTPIAVGTFREAFPLWLSALAILIYTRADQLFVSYFAGDAELGLYAAAVRLSEIAYFIPVAVVAASAPILADAKKNNQERYRDEVIVLFRTLWAIGISVVVVTVPLAEEIVFLAFGSQYQGSADLLAIHIFGFLFVCLGVAQGTWLVNERLTRVALSRTALGAVTGLLGNLALVPKLGAQGAAISVVVAQALSAVASNMLDHRTRPVFFLQLRIMLFLPIPKTLNVEPRQA